MREHIALLASTSAQLEYQRNVPHVPVIGELICGFADDLYHPASVDFIRSFSEDELRGLAILYGLIHRASQAMSHQGIRELEAALKTLEWREVIAFAKDLRLE